ncbi:Colicin-D [Serratia rubidaea]|uniref:S-type pyocin domain-containing protein n=1 Tax=Serratia rubidaea TaxID=61652 RepID=UPI0006C741F1|nr:S-type pyocin domain-containing protein [Serratia rubidaea]QPR61841.1 S-type pyocin domain-containing protein [Serratia rubidaea]CAI0933793.1 Colicin-D [Serratia rubidaea]CAI1752425.1 Colicin-D [Serratia rubidaea]HAY0636699.1 hypothetical protein [Serratia rubidaea]
MSDDKHQKNHENKRGGNDDSSLYTYLGDGKFKFKSQTKVCYLKPLNALGWSWVMDRNDGQGVAACFASEAEKRAAVAKLSGMLPAPEYTEKEAQTASSLLAEAGALALNRVSGAMQLSVAGEGVATLAGEAASALSAALSRVAALLTASVTGPVAASASALLFSSSVGEGSDKVPGRDVPALFSYPASAMLPREYRLQPGTETVDLPVRASLAVKNGQLALSLLKTGSGEVPKAVQVLTAVRDEASGLDKITVPAVAGAPAQTILINPAPAKPTAPSNTGNSSPAPVTPVHTGTTVTPVDNIATTPPVPTLDGCRDFIYWQPNAKGTGVEPVYVVLSSPRDMPGKVSGNGQQVGDGWLNKAGQELGAPIPSQIADKLRGREFVNFGAFRKAFWTEVGKDHELNKQFKSGNLGNIQAGKAPATRDKEQVGGRVKYELHHMKPIKNNGEVYNVDNISVTTPKRHIEIHREVK